MAFIDFTAGEVLTAAQMDTTFRQTVMRFPDAGTRDTALTTVLAEGMICYLDDTDEILKYNGASWVSISNPGDITAVTAGTALSGGGTAGDVTLDVDLSAVATAVAGTALTADGSTLNVDETALSINATQISNTLTSSTATAYTLQTADANKYLQFTNAATITVSTATDFATGEQVTILADGTALTVTTDGATIAGGGTSTTSGSVTAGGQYEAVSILCVGTDDYRVVGNITAVE